MFYLPQSIGDRLLYGLACPFFILILAVSLIVIQDWQPSGWAGITLKFLVEDALLVFCLLFVLGFVWCLFKPAWIARLASKKARIAKVYGVAFVLGLAILLVVSEIK